MASLKFDVLSKDLHDSANDLLHSQIINSGGIFLHPHRREVKRVVHEVSEESVRMIDVCDATKDILRLVKDHLQDLQSTFRRIAAGETVAMENKFEAYQIYRRKLRKEMSKYLRSLKGKEKDNKNIASEISSTACQNQNQNQNLVAVVNVIREARDKNIFVVESLISLMSIPSPNGKSSKGSLASKLKRVNSLSWCEKCDVIALQIANKRLAAVETAIEDLESELECMFRRLMKTRALLLNVLTHQRFHYQDQIAHHKFMSN